MPMVVCPCKEVEAAIIRTLYQLLTKAPSEHKQRCAELCMEVIQETLSNTSPLYLGVKIFWTATECQKRMSTFLRNKNLEEEITDGTEETSSYHSAPG